MTGLEVDIDWSGGGGGGGGGGGYRTSDMLLLESDSVRHVIATILVLY
jgi:hypothetical protein